MLAVSGWVSGLIWGYIAWAATSLIASALAGFLVIEVDREFLGE